MQKFSKKEKEEIYNAVCALYVYTRDHTPENRERIIRLLEIIRKLDTNMKKRGNKFSKTGSK